MARLSITLICCAMITVLGAGCFSSRALTSLVPQSDPALTSPAGMFRVADVKYTSLKPDGQVAVDMVKSPGIRLLPVLRTECAMRYPGLFVDSESGDAIPLAVDVKVTTRQHNAKTLAWMLGTGMLAGLVFPCPGGMDEDVAVSIGVWNGQPVDSSLRMDFRTETYAWSSLLTPLGLITIPGKSDLPKASGTVFAMQNWEEDYLRQTAQQLATATALTAVTQEPAYWAAQPRGNTVDLDRTISAPAALPPPPGSNSPF